MLLESKRLIGKRILFATVPFHANIRSLMGLALHLQSQGAEVRWYASGMFAGEIIANGFLHYPFRLANDIQGKQMERVYQERKKIKGKFKLANYDMINFFAIQALEYFFDIRSICQSYDPHLLICDNAFTGIPFIKKKIGLPVITIGLFPLAENSDDTYRTCLGLVPRQSLLNRLMRGVLNKITDDILFKSAISVYDNLLISYDIECYGTIMFDTLIRKSDIFIQPGTELFDYPRKIFGQNIVFTGRLPDYPNKSSSCWNDNRLTVFKTVAFLSQQELSQTDNLVVPTLAALLNTDTLVVISTNGHRTEEMKQRFSANNVIIDDFIPEKAIFPYASVSIINGGFCDVLKSLSMGIPVITIGSLEGRNEVSARIRYTEMGIALSKEAPRPEQIRRAVEEIIQQPKFKVNAVRFSKYLNRIDSGQHITEEIVKLTSKFTREQPES